MSQSHPSGEASGGRGRISEDPLSMFLLVAALILGGMYLWDEWQLGRVEDQIAEAQYIAARPSLEACQVGTAGLAGEVLVVSCEGEDSEQTAARLSRAGDLESALAPFEQVAFRDAKATLRCPATPSTWTAECQVVDRQPPAASR